MPPLARSPTRPGWRSSSARRASVKTALARAFTRDARAQGATVLLGSAYDLSEPPPYAVWLDLLDTATPAGPHEALDAARAALQPMADGPLAARWRSSRGRSRGSLRCRGGAR